MPRPPSARKSGSLATGGLGEQSQTSSTRCFPARRRSTHTGLPGAYRILLVTSSLTMSRASSTSPTYPNASNSRVTNRRARPAACGCGSSLTSMSMAGRGRVMEVWEHILGISAYTKTRWGRLGVASSGESPAFGVGTASTSQPLPAVPAAPADCCRNSARGSRPRPGQTWARMDMWGCIVTARPPAPDFSDYCTRASGNSKAATMPTPTCLIYARYICPDRPRPEGLDFPGDSLEPPLA
jgi:hypothetical protein